MPNTKTYTLTLATGEARSIIAASTPKNWKSQLMREFPYGTRFDGATFRVD